MADQDYVRRIAAKRLAAMPRRVVHGRPGIIPEQSAEERRQNSDQWLRKKIDAPTRQDRAHAAAERLREAGANADLEDWRMRQQEIADRHAGGHFPPINDPQWLPAPFEVVNMNPGADYSYWHPRGPSGPPSNPPVLVNVNEARWQPSAPVAATNPHYIGDPRDPPWFFDEDLDPPRVWREGSSDYQEPPAWRKPK